MSLLDPKAQASLDAFVYRQLLHGAGLDRGLSGMAGMVFTDVLSQAIANGSAPLLPKAAADGVSSGFGARSDPFTHQPSHHDGVDLPAQHGAPITAAFAGRVVQAGDRGGYGTAVELDHGDGVHTLYAHASSLRVKVGELVQAGQPIAEVGSSGRSTGPHLHLEMRVDGRAVDPSAALKAYQERAEDRGEGKPP